MKPCVIVVATAVLSTLLAACAGGDKGAGSSVTPRSVPPGSVPSGAPDGVKTYAGLSHEHTSDDVKYEQNPPVGGPHDPVWQPCGYYDNPIRAERGVHSMEHGAVWITYQPTLPADQIAVLKSLMPGHAHLLIAPFPGIPTPVVASAWGEQLQLPSATDPRLTQFVKFFEEGAQTPEPGAPC